MPKISELPSGSSPAGSEEIPAVQGGATVKLTRAQITQDSQPLDATLTSISSKALLGTGDIVLSSALSGYQPVDSDLTAIAALTTTAYGRSLLTLANATALAAEVDSFFLTPAEGSAAYQPLDSDLTAIAALTTTSYGRAFLALADAAAARSAVGLATTTTDNALSRFDGTAGATQNSGVTIGDDNQVLNRASGFTNTGTKEPHGFRVDRRGSDISSGYGSFQSLIQSGASATSAANTDWPMVGTADLITMSGWVLNWGSTPLLKNAIAGNFGVAFENISTNPAQATWGLELDIGNYTGTGSTLDERYGVGLKVQAFGSNGSAVSKGVAISRSTSDTGTGFTHGIHMDGVRDVGIAFEAMTETGALTIFNSKLSGDANARFAAEYTGQLSWGSGSASADTTLTRLTGGGLSASGTGPLTVTNTTNSNNVQVAVLQGDRASAADGDTAYVSLALSNDGGTQAEFARIGWQAADATAGSGLDGLVFVAVEVGGSLTTHLRLEGGAANPGSDDGTSLGTSSLKWSDLFLASGSVINFNSGDVTLTHSADTLTVAGGTIAAPTQTARDNSTKVATTAYVDGATREKLSANRTYYVRTDGSNSNTGLVNSAGGAFLTLQKAWDTIITLDLAGYTVTIKMADTGTRTTGIIATSPAVGGLVVVEGDTGTPANTLISTTSADAFNFSGGAKVTLQYLKIQTTTSGNGVVADGGGSSVILGSGVNIGACALQAMLAQNLGFVRCSAGLTVSGNSVALMYVQSGGVMSHSGTFTLSGTPVWGTAGIVFDTGGIISLFGSVSFSGASTGKRYQGTMNAVLQSFGAGTSSTYFPGSTNGTTATGAQQG